MLPRRPNELQRTNSDLLSTKHPGWSTDAIDDDLAAGRCINRATTKWRLEIGIAENSGDLGGGRNLPDESRARWPLETNTRRRWRIPGGSIFPRNPDELLAGRHERPCQLTQGVSGKNVDE
ncbi:hypothetical protein KM043_013712 [Ampulex compressa]|nr:hypothetical protein KM043_013712 [Ampulex compressa]